MKTYFKVLKIFCRVNTILISKYTITQKMCNRVFRNYKTSLSLSLSIYIYIYIYMCVYLFANFVFIVKFSFHFYFYFHFSFKISTIIDRCILIECIFIWTIYIKLINKL